MTTQELLRLAVLICVFLHRTGFSCVSCCHGHYWCPTTSGSLSGHSYEEETNGALQVSGRIMDGCEHAQNNSHLTPQLQNGRAGGSARPRVSQMCIIDISNDSSRPLQKGGKKFLQLQVGISTTVCLDHFHHQIPNSFSLLQLSWLRH